MQSFAGRSAAIICVVAILSLALGTAVANDRAGPIAAFTYNPCVMCAAPGDVVFFNANTSLSLRAIIVSYTWNFGDGSPPVKTNSSLETHDFLYAIPGHRLVTLTVQDINGMTDTTSQMVLFNGAPDFEVAPPLPFAGESITFNGSMTRGYQSPFPPSTDVLFNIL